VAILLNLVKSNGYHSNTVHHYRRKWDLKATTSPPEYAPDGSNNA